MKIKFAVSLSLVMAVLAISLSSCNKKSTEVIQPAYPQFIGTWQGTTNQNQQIRIGIMALNELLVVNTYNYDVIRYDSGGSSHRTKHYEVSTSTVVTSVVNKYFKFYPYDPLGTSDYLTGTFNDTTMTLNGQFSSVFPKLTGSGSDIISGSYTATKVK
jgi:hypothetical protein